MRFCVRNSGVSTVVEGVGDHGCEYMTGGRVVIIGDTGRNFAAGMSGGIAYIYDPAQRFPALCNQEMVNLSELSAKEDIDCVHNLLSNHLRYTQSTVAEKILDDWQKNQAHFVKVMPTDYERVLKAMEKARQTGVPEDEAVMEAANG